MKFQIFNIIATITAISAVAAAEAVAPSEPKNTMLRGGEKLDLLQEVEDFAGGIHQQERELRPSQIKIKIFNKQAQSMKMKVMCVNDSGNVIETDVVSDVTDRLVKKALITNNNCAKIKVRFYHYDIGWDELSRENNVDIIELDENSVAINANLYDKWDVLTDNTDYGEAFRLVPNQGKDVINNSQWCFVVRDSWYRKGGTQFDIKYYKNYNKCD